jgi:hypothetical protein
MAWFFLLHVAGRAEKHQKHGDGCNADKEQLISPFLKRRRAVLRFAYLASRPPYPQPFLNRPILNQLADL